MSKISLNTSDPSPSPAITGSRRSFLARSTAVAASSVLTGATIPAVHAAEDPTIRRALIGCGSRGAGAVADALAASGGPVRLYAMADVSREQIDWRMPDEERTPWQAEWQVLLDAIRNDTPHDETRRSCLANLAALMGRAAAHGGQIVTRDQIMQSRFAFCPDVDRLRAGSPPPVQRNDAGSYPAPEPGRWQEV